MDRDDRARFQMMHIAYVVVFLLFDREAGRVRPATITGLAVVVLAAVAHVWLGESWMQQAGFPAAPHGAPWPGR